MTSNFLKHGHFYIGFYRGNYFLNKNMPLSSLASNYAVLQAKIKSGK